MHPQFVFHTQFSPPLFPAIVLVMLFSSSFLQFSAALSAAVALSSNQFPLILPSTLFHFLFFRTILLSLSLFKSFQSRTLYIKFCVLPLLNFFPRRVSYPWLALLFYLPITFYVASLYVTKILLCFLWIFYILYRCKPVLHLNVISPPDLFTLQLTHVKSHTCFLLPMRLCQL